MEWVLKVDNVMQPALENLTQRQHLPCVLLDNVSSHPQLAPPVLEEICHTPPRKCQTSKLFLSAVDKDQPQCQDLPFQRTA